MLYDPDRDLYQMLAVSADAEEGQIRMRIEGLRGVKDDRDLDHAALMLLDLESRTRYDTQRATHRMRTLRRDGLAIFSGGAPAQGIPNSRPRYGS
jgi:hypothetical protein